MQGKVTKKAEGPAVVKGEPRVPANEKNAVIVEALIEIPTGSQNKYEFDKERGLLRLDRVLYSPIYYPADYGYVPETLAEDGDPLDILVLVTNPTIPGCLIDARVIGALEMVDGGEADYKLLAVPVRDPRFKHMETLEDVAPHVLREIEYFFKTYKDLEDKVTEVKSWRDLQFAQTAVDRARAAYGAQVRS